MLRALQSAPLLRFATARAHALTPKGLPAMAAAQTYARAFGSRRGSVKFFNAERGFGFILSDDEDIFVHYTGIESSGGFRSLADGEEVEFDTEKDHSGKTRAVRVTGPNGAPVKGTQRQNYE